GYCGRQDTSHTFGAWAHSLTVHGYKKMIDHGWRRSGCYIYKPNLVQSCCQLYTIKLNAHAFKANKQQRAAVRKFHDFVLKSSQPCKTMEEYLASTDASSRFSADLEPAQFTDEKFALYKKYQMAIHGDKESELQPSSFKRFLCDTPLEGPNRFGSFHQMYRLDGKLIAVAVLDLLPGCVSSVYFLYDPDYRSLSLGRVSACREAIMSKAEPFGEYYMGYFIPDCVKMKYKGEYAPSFLKDPASTHWYPLE
ncbi:arginine-tRNA-protein transferase, partial [Protomyces lactucae-debilis]